MSTLHLNLVLAVGKTYVDVKGDKVTLIREFTKDDADFLQGFRFRGDNGINYLANGEVTGSLGTAIRVEQMGAYPLKAEYVEQMFDDTVILKDIHLQLEEGKLYRNGLGQAVLIIGTPPVDSHWHKRGYRFMDQRGTFYKPNGSVDSWPWGSLDIVMAITSDSPLSEMVTDKEMDKIMEGVNHMIAKMDGKSGIKWNNMVLKFGLFCKKSMKGMGVASASLAVGNISAGRTKEAAWFGLYAAAAFGFDKLTGSIRDYEDMVERNLTR